MILEHLMQMQTLKAHEEKVMKILLCIYGVGDEWTQSKYKGCGDHILRSAPRFSQLMSDV
jgi:hypothetical protein